MTRRLRPSLTLHQRVRLEADRPTRPSPIPTTTYTVTRGMRLSLVLLATMAASCGINPATFAGLRSASRYVSESFSGDLSRRRLDALVSALTAEIASARSKAWPAWSWLDWKKAQL